MSDNQSDNSIEWWEVPASNMPKFDQVKQLYTMKMERIIVQHYPVELHETNIDLVDRVLNTHSCAYVAVATVDDDRVRGYLPSKVWINNDNQTEMLFYVNDTLPDGARPFGTGPMYVWQICVPSNITVEYDVEARVFVDQVLDKDGNCWYVFVCGHDHLNNLIITGNKDNQ